MMENNFNQGYQQGYSQQGYPQQSQQQGYGQDGGHEFSWDGTVTQEGESFVLLPEGDYSFRIQKLERGRFNGSQKMTSCPIAKLELYISDGKGNEGIIHHDIFLHSFKEREISNFFISIGQKKKGQPFQMNWNNVVGASGKCKVVVNKWLGNDGQEKKNNKIIKFYDPTENAPQSQQNTVPAGYGYKPGTF